MLPLKSFTLALALLLATVLQAQQPPALVKTATAESTSMAPTRVVAAASKAKYITTIKAETSGRILELAAIGQSLQTGDPMGLIADDDYALRRTELLNAITSQQAQVDFLQSEAVRLKSLKEQKLTSITALDKNTADLKTARADLAQAKSRLKQLELDIYKLTPKAPFNGFISAHMAQPGEWANQGQDLLQLMSSDEIEVVAQVPYKLKSVLQAGQQWQFVDSSGQIAMAEVERFVPAATSNSRLIEVHLKDLSGALLPGEPIQLQVPETAPTSVLAVPRDALVLRRQGAYLFVIKEGIAHRVDVQTGLAQGDLIAVTGNLNAGDQVVIRGNERLRDQQPVQLMDGSQ